jgi:1-aminocyclopropane-1-carboxylate deaminase/D-cysteine desulfhydrase-like pyridoxal-dependent ACC family enzyme
VRNRKKAKKINDSDMIGDDNSSNQSIYIKRDDLRDRLVEGGKWAEDLESTRYGGAGGL